MPAFAPGGSDWMCVARPIATSESSSCWARWLPITTKWLTWRIFTWMTPPDGAWEGEITCWVSIGKPSSSSVVRPSLGMAIPAGAVTV